MKLGLVLIHGDVQDRSRVDAIVRRLKLRALEEAVVIPTARPPRGADEMLAIAHVAWDGVLTARHRQLRDVLQADHCPLIVKGSWLRAGWRMIAAAGRRMRAQALAESLGQVLAYREPSAQAAIQAALTESLDRVAAQAGAASGKAPVTVVAHGLGTIIGSEYIWDRTVERLRRQESGFHSSLTLHNIFTIGSPLALWSLRTAGPEAFAHPIAMEHSQGRWVNLYDQQDPLGLPLRPLNAAYASAVLKDVQLDAGAGLRAPLGYFNDPHVLTIISRKLALDWLALNKRLPAAKMHELYARYDEGLSI